MNIHVDRAVKLAGGQAALAKALQVTPQLVWQWVRGLRPVGPKQATAIEAVTAGAVKRADLRPDIFAEPQKKQGVA